MKPIREEAMREISDNPRASVYIGAVSFVLFLMTVL